MQIHEITQRKLDEGLLDTVKSAVSGAQAGYRASQGNRTVQMIADKAYPIWAAYAKRLEQSITDPTAKQAFDNRSDGLYQRALMAFVQQNLLKNVRIDDTINKDQIKAVIQKLSEPKITSATPAPATPAPATPAPATPAPATPAPAKSAKTTQSTIIDPATNKPFNSAAVSEALNATTEKQLFTQLVQLASLAQPNAEKGSQPTVRLISRDPAIVKFDGRTYGLNDNGQWADIKNSREPEESVKAYLDQIANIK
jgi:hypothetical protein